MDPTAWTLTPKGYVSIGTPVSRLPPAVYEVTQPRDVLIFCACTINTDSAVVFKQNTHAKVLEEVTRFWGQESQYTRYGFLHRRGYLLYGPAGSGKSILVKQMISECLELGGVAFMCSSPGLLSRGLALFRKVEPKRPVLCIFEDIDSIIREYGDRELLGLLDGESQINNVLNLATTNYPERLDPRIVARPRRFDQVVKIDNPDMDTRLQFFTAKLPEPERAQEFAKATDKLSIAALTEVIISVYCHKRPLGEASDILRNLSEARPSSDQFVSTRCGFTGGK